MARPSGTQKDPYHMEPPDDMVGIGMGSMESLPSSNASYSTSESAPSSRKGPAIAHDAETVRTMGPRGLQNNPNFRSTWSRSSNGLVWTSEQDEVLRAGLLRHGCEDWKVLADHLATCGSFSEADCKLRWAEIKELPVKGPWSSDEDGLLCDLVARFGPKPKKWSFIATHIPGRAGKQCRERWLNHLDVSVKKGEWTFEEDRILCQAQREVGNKWSEIAKLLPGRAENSVKNRYNSLITRRQIANGTCIGNGGNIGMMGMAKGPMGPLEHMRPLSPMPCLPPAPVPPRLPPKALKPGSKNNGGVGRRPGRPRKNAPKPNKDRSPSPVKTRTSTRTIKKKAPPVMPPTPSRQARQTRQARQARQARQREEEEEEDEEEEEEEDAQPYMVEEPLLSDSEMDTLLASLDSSEPSLPYLPNTDPYPPGLDHSTSTLSTLNTHPSPHALQAPALEFGGGLDMGPFLYIPKAPGPSPAILQSLMTPQASLPPPLCGTPSGYFPFSSSAPPQACSPYAPQGSYLSTPSILRPPGGGSHRTRHHRKSRRTMTRPPLPSPAAQYLSPMAYPGPQLYGLPQAEALAAAYLQQLQAATQAFKNALPTPTSLGFPPMLLHFPPPLLADPNGSLCMDSVLGGPDPRSHTDTGEFVSPLPSPHTHHHHMNHQDHHQHSSEEEEMDMDMEHEHENDHEEHDEPSQTLPSPRAPQPSPAYLMGGNALYHSVGSEDWSLLEPIMAPGDDGHSLAGGMDEGSHTHRGSSGHNTHTHYGHGQAHHGGSGHGSGPVTQDRASGQSSTRHNAGTPFSIDFSWLDQQQQGSYSAELYEAHFGGQATPGGAVGSKRGTPAHNNNMRAPAAWSVEGDEDDIGMVDFDETGEDQHCLQGMLGEASKTDMVEQRPTKRMR